MAKFVVGRIMRTPKVAAALLLLLLMVMVLTTSPATAVSDSVESKSSYKLNYLHTIITIPTKIQPGIRTT